MRTNTFARAPGEDDKSKPDVVAIKQALDVMLHVLGPMHMTELIKHMAQVAARATTIGGNEEVHGGFYSIDGVAFVYLGTRPLLELHQDPEVVRYLNEAKVDIRELKGEKKAEN